MKYWFMKAKIVFCTFHGPEKGSKYHLETIKTTFSENNNYYRAIFVKINFFHAWKCIISGVKYRSNFWHRKVNCDLFGSPVFTLFFDKDKPLTFILSILIPKRKSILSRSKKKEKKSGFIDSRLSVASDELDTFFVILYELQGGLSMMLLHQKTASLIVHTVCISWSVALIAQLVMGRTILLIWALNKLA